MNDPRPVIAEQHRALLLTLDRLRLMVAAPAQTLPPERARPMWSFELAGLRDQLAAHFAFEEEGGYMNEVIKRRPGLSRQVDELGAEHGQMLETLDGLQAELAVVDLEGVGSRVLGIVDIVARHERRETELLSRVFAEDLGGGD